MGPATAYILMSSVETTDKRFEAEVRSTAVVNMFGISGSTSVSTVGAVQADPSQPTLRVEALSPGNLSTKLVTLASISSTSHEDADGSIADHPVTFEDIPGRTLVVGWAPEFQQNQTMYRSGVGFQRPFPRGS